MEISEAEAIGRRAQAVLASIRGAEQRAGRPPGSVRLIAATKSIPPERIRSAIAAGVRILGESRLQEALPKIAAIGTGAGVAWHFIGRLQRRKVKAVVETFDMVQSVESLELAAEIDRRAGEAGLVLPVLLEVNVGGEASKGGFTPEALPSAALALEMFPHLAVQGLMTIPPATATAEEARPYFRRLRECAEAVTRLDLRRVRMVELSMGMSQDYEVAVEEGATFVRVGTAIFGAR